MEETNPELPIKRRRILLADDDQLMRAAVQALLAPDFEIVEMVSDGNALIEAAFRLMPDVIVCDVSMPRMSGFGAARAIRAARPEIKFIFLTMHGSPRYRLEAQSLGAAGYVLKSSAPEELTKTVRNALIST